ncbi:MAG: hypothetical protein NWF14_00150 [Candidatus Bathyarchaeota archaeon]|nr:hypothetical protein [Candidatus Bathyarchaeota archaeon]
MSSNPVAFYRHSCLSAWERRSANLEQRFTHLSDVFPVQQFRFEVRVEDYRDV